MEDILSIAIICYSIVFSYDYISEVDEQEGVILNSGRGRSSYGETCHDDLIQPLHICNSIGLVYTSINRTILVILVSTEMPNL